MTSPRFWRAFFAQPDEIGIPAVIGAFLAITIASATLWLLALHLLELITRGIGAALASQVLHQPLAEAATQRTVGQR